MIVQKREPEIYQKNGSKPPIKLNKEQKTPIPDNIREELTKLNNRLTSLKNSVSDIKSIVLPRDVLCNLLEGYLGKKVTIMLPCGTSHEIQLTHFDKFVVAGTLPDGKKKIFIRSRIECIDLP
jgi:hypothetical protein